MRELDRQRADHSQEAASHPIKPGGASTALAAASVESVALVGRGRVGTTLARAFTDAGLTVHGPFGREAVTVAEGTNGGGAFDAVLLCVPDSEIRSAAGAFAHIAPLVGHTSGATPLSAMAPAEARGAELFGLHPLQTLTGDTGAHRLAGASCAVAGSTPRALAAARDLAEGVGLEPFEIADEQRAAYHAAASTASNFLVTLQDSAETIARGAGMPPADARRALLPLVRATVENWARTGPEEALTGPVARGDDDTVAAQRAAVERAEPAMLALFDALVDRTRHLAARRRGAVSHGSGVGGGT
jgi:predicted short-subunit dehydrogenase-like oxidoreductase (DUF2520 family)